MRIRVEEFPARLKARLLPFYLLYGDEPLLVQECADALRATCRDGGIGERQVFDVDASFDWNRLGAECSGLSLFGDRKLIEVRPAGAKLGAEGSAMLRELAAQPASDNVVLVLGGKLDRDVEKSAWFRALDEAGATVRACRCGATSCRAGSASDCAPRASSPAPTRWRCWPSASRATCSPRARRSTSSRCWRSPARWTPPRWRRW
ncbi:MAG: DNA polymerase III subunit delta [Gammaproteobacteria bacterium]|nr:DNA polymerase III subunit delta [Gammaproteobacteria bacterium]